jgi:hypothetical protein
MRPRRTRKKRIVCRRSPKGVGQPPLDVVNKKPKRLWVILYVSGFAIKKKTSAL